MRLVVLEMARLKQLTLKGEVNMEFLKKLFSEDSLNYEEFARACKDSGIKLADLSTGDYVSKKKYDSLTNELQEKNDEINNLEKKSKSDIKETKAELEAQMTEIKKQNALNLAIVKARPKNEKALKGALGIDLNELEFDDNFEKTINEAIEGLKESDGYLFSEADMNLSSFKPKTEDNGNENKALSYADFLVAEGNVE